MDMLSELTRLEMRVDRIEQDVLEEEKMVVQTTRVIPTKKHDSDIGYDLKAAESTTVYGRPQGWRGLIRYLFSFFKSYPTTQIIQTGFRAKSPEGAGLFICSRSGLGSKGIWVANSPGVIDPNYTGDISVILHNSGEDDFVVNVGDRIAQAVWLKYYSPEFEKVKSLKETKRGDGGLGSTGIQ